MTKSKFRPKENQRKEGRKKKKKLHIVFDTDARKEYLTGFRKRKQEKKAKYRSQLEKKVALEKQRLKEEAKKSLNMKKSSSHSILPEVEALLASDPSFSNTVSHEIGSKSVTISSIDTLNPILPPVEESQEDSEEDETGTEPTDEDPVRMKSNLKKTMNQMLQRSKVFKAVQRLKTKKNLRKQRHRKGNNQSGSKKSDKEGSDGGKINGKSKSKKHFKGGGGGGRKK